MIVLVVLLLIVLLITLIRRKPYRESFITKDYSKYDKNDKMLVHIPKTGGTSLTKIPSVRSPSSFGSIVSHNKLPNNIKENLYVFAIMRDPYDRFESAFWHHKTLGDPKHHWNIDSLGSKIRHHFEDPNQFIRAIQDPEHPKHIIAKNQFRYWVHFKPQVDWLKDSQGVIDTRITDIFVYNKELGTMLNKHPMFKGEKVPFLNKTPSHNRVGLDDNSKKFIEEYYKEDLEMFNSIK